VTPPDGIPERDDLQVEGLIVRFADFQLGPVDFVVEEGHALAMIGTNGAGKSTLIRTLLGLENVHRGSVTWSGLPLNARSSSVISDVGYVSDSNRDVLPEFTSDEYWRYHLLAFEHASGRRDPDALDRAEHYAKLLDFPFGRPIALGQLSLGTSRKAQIIAALMTDPQLLILDEPFVGLDFLSSRALESVLAGLHASGRTIIVSNHDLDLAARLATDVLVIHQGRVVLNSSIAALGGTANLETHVSAALEAARRHS
jgi:ABC-type multidrug transport system ATPase subunit